ncbi:MAG: threonine ammonia-lyase [Campylobacterales bacterium]
MLELKNFIEANRNVKKVSLRTPFAYAPYLSRIKDANIYIKKENLQLTGAYKIRGAFNKIASLSEEERKNGVIASSAGNHAQGVAYSAKYFGIKSIIVMPEATPLTKVTGAKQFGAEIILHGNSYDEAYKYALEYSKKHSLSFIHPFEDDVVIAGQGTVALEMIEDNDSIDTVVVPIGGGGLISGIAAVYKQMFPNVRVIGVTASGAPAMRNSYINKAPSGSLYLRTIADGIAVRVTSERTLGYILESVDDIVEVSDEEIASAVLFILEQQKLVAEGAGAAGIAALLHDKIDIKKGENIGVVLTGGNIDVTMLSVIIEKGLLKSYRKMNLVVTLIDKPGSLMRLTEILTSINTNIVQIGYDRVSTALDYGDANVTIALETRGEEHQKQIKETLSKEGYKFIDKI